MKKAGYILGILFVVLVGIWFFAKPKIAQTLATSTEIFLATLDPNYASVQAEIIPDTCRFSSCIMLKNTQATLWNIPIMAGDIEIALHPRLPLSFTVKTLSTTPPPQLILDTTIIGNTVDIGYSSLTIGDFNATLNGTIDASSGHINAALSTVNLASFLIPLLPQNIQFLAQLFLSNAPQTLPVRDENGWITVQGLPLFPLQ